MKIKYNFLSTMLMAILTICCLWIVTDVAYGVRMWELGVDAWIGRIKALVYQSFKEQYICSIIIHLLTH
ncbi:hypothetical protein [Parabacteroides distasonis]|uniref:hypothetical protein n=1 Tax=Parabacteroides distasonis TaxID=823 RepID=UPI001E2F668B|nr:hypothetical protein [Parabacteroides distasonis]